MTAFARGDFDQHTELEELYVGDESKVMLSMRQTSALLSEKLHEINTSADQVSMGLGRISDDAQTLAQGITEQTFSIQQLSRRFTRFRSRWTKIQKVSWKQMKM